MVAYLLGELPETETEVMEERYIADEAAFRELRAIEAGLYNAYARGTLSLVANRPRVPS